MSEQELVQNVFMATSAVYRVYSALIKMGRREEADRVMMMHQDLSEIAIDAQKRDDEATR